MRTPDDEPTAQEALPDELVETIDHLDAPALQQLSVYVSERLAKSSKPIEEMIREEAHGEILDIEDQGAYWLVRKRSPSQQDSEAGSQAVSLYHVRRKRQPDGEEALHWSYIGKADD